jgi:hypothetical protein
MSNTRVAERIFMAFHGRKATPTSPGAPLSYAESERLSLNSSSGEMDVDRNRISSSAQVAKPLERCCYIFGANGT